MGEVLEGEPEPRLVFVGEAGSSAEGEAPTLNEALESAAGKAIQAGLIGPGRTAWFDVAFVEVELGNQHPRTYKVGVTPKIPGS